MLLLAAGCGGTPAPGTLGVAAPSTRATAIPAATVGPRPTVTGMPATTASSGLPLDSGNGRSAAVQVVLSGTSFQADGSYSATGPARLCGNGDINMTGNQRAFSFQFPLDLGTSKITDVTFHAGDLVPGSTTDALYVSINVRTADGHEPPATVVDSEAPTPGDTGEASLSDSAGTRTLVVNATNDFGETIQLTASCAP